MTFSVENNCHLVTKTTKQNPPLCQQQILKAAMCSRTSRASWTYFPQGPLNIPQILHSVLNQRTHFIIPFSHLRELEEELTGAAT